MSVWDNARAEIVITSLSYVWIAVHFGDFANAKKYQREAERFLALPRPR
jgi:hypothetical protein